MGFGIQYAKKQIEVTSVRFHQSKKSEGAGGIIEENLTDWVK